MYCVFPLLPPLTLDMFVSLFVFPLLKCLFHALLLFSFVTLFPYVSFRMFQDFRFPDSANSRCLSSLTALFPPSSRHSELSPNPNSVFSSSSLIQFFLAINIVKTSSTTKKTRVVGSKQSTVFHKISASTGKKTFQ